VNHRAGGNDRRLKGLKLVGQPAAAHRIDSDQLPFDNNRRPTPPAAAGLMFPRVSTWSRDELGVAIDLAARRELGMNLHPVGDAPDRHERFLDEATTELLRRLTDKVAGAAPRLAA
jgi:hypothetical protein